MRNLFIFVLALAPVVHASEPYRGPIIDVHMHSYSDAAEIPQEKNPITGRAPGAKTGVEHRAASLAAMKRHNITLGIVSSGGDAPMASALEWQKANSIFIASAGIDGGDVTPIPPLDELRAYRVIGEIGAQYQGLSLADPRFEPMLAFAEEMDLPVAVHTGISFPGISYQPCCRRFRTPFGNPQTIEEVLNRHPKLRVWLMHAGWPYTQETIAMMSVYPQLYADIAVINWIMPNEAFQEHLRALVRAGLADRLMFGSDQMMWPEAIDLAVKGVESATFLTAAQKRDIFCANAERFFRLKDACTSSK